MAKEPIAAPVATEYKTKLLAFNGKDITISDRGTGTIKDSISLEDAINAGMFKALKSAKHPNLLVVTENKDSNKCSISLKFPNGETANVGIKAEFIAEKMKTATKYKDSNNGHPMYFVNMLEDATLYVLEDDTTKQLYFRIGKTPATNEDVSW